MVNVRVYGKGSYNGCLCIYLAMDDCMIAGVYVMEEIMVCDMGGRVMGVVSHCYKMTNYCRVVCNLTLLQDD